MALIGNAAEAEPGAGAARLASRRRHRPDQRPRPARRVCPQRHRPGRGAGTARRKPRTSTSVDRRQPWPITSAPCSSSSAAARSPSTTATTSAPFAKDAGVENAFDIPGFVPAFIRPLFCEGRGPFRVAALSGDPADIARIDRALSELFPDDAGLQRWLRLAAEKVPVQGLPARICWLGYGERARAGAAINDLVASGEVSAPIVIGRDHLDAGSVASPVPRDGGDARRLGRDRRLADPQRPGQHRRRRHLGQLPPRRRRRHRLLAPRRHGGRRRRDPGGRRAARARADLRSRHGRHPPRRCRLRARARGRPRARRPDPDDGRT